MSTDQRTRPRAAAKPPAVAPLPAAPEIGPTREKLNLRLLAWLTAAAVVFGLAWAGLNWWQVRRHVAALLVQADAAEAQGRPDRAARFLGLYVGMVPDDIDARVRYGQTLDHMASTPRAKGAAMAVFEQVLLRDPERHAIRRRLATLDVETGQLDDALQHLAYLKKALPDDAEIDEMMGRCHEGRAQYTQAVEDYQAALKQEPGRVDSALRLARVLRDQLSRKPEADKLLADLVQSNPRSYQARLARAQYLQDGAPSADALKAARADLEEALRLAPDEPDVLLAAAHEAARRPDGRDEARGYLAKLLDQKPVDAAGWGKLLRGFEELADLELRAGKPQEAVRALRRGLDRLPDAPDLLWNLANLVVQTGTPEEGDPLVKRLVQADFPAPRVAYLRAALRLRRGDWAGARRDLEAVRPLLVDSRDITIQCDLLLARCDEALGDLDAQVLVCRRLLTLDPGRTDAAVLLATALSKLGRGTEALEECRRLADGPGASREGRLLMARLLILQNLRLPAERRQWDQVEPILDQAADAPETPLLRAEMLVARNEAAKARAVLTAAKDKDPARADLWFALADLEAREGKPEDGLHVLDAAERQLGDSAGLRLARLRCFLAAANVDEKAIASLEDGLDRLTEDDRIRVLNGLAEVQSQRGRWTEARRLWEETARLRPNDVDVRQQLFDLALRDGDDGRIKEALEAVRHVEGEGGPLGLYDDARRLITLAVKGDKSGLTQARAEVEDVAKRRPAWSRTSVCLGQIDELEGHEDRALENYMRAIDLGERQFEVLRRTVQLLYKHKRYTDAELVIQRLQEQNPALGDLQRVAAEISFQTGDYNRVLELADKAVAKDSTNYQDFIWLGQVLWAASQRADISPEQRRQAVARAEKALWQGARMGAKTPDGWIVLVQYLARAGATDRADEAIHEAEGKLSAEDAPAFLAQCYAMLDRPERAREQFQAALKARPEDAALLRTAANFYLRVNDVEEAKKCLRTIAGLGAKHAEDVAWAQSVLAVVLASSGDYRQQREATQLLGLSDGKTASPSDSVEQERARAVVLATMPGRRERLQAIAILERFADRQTLSLEDRFLLVQLDAQIGQPQKAWDLMVPLLQAGRDPRYLAYAVGFLLDQNRLDEAETWLSDLETVLRKSPSQPLRTAYQLRTAFLRARLSKAQGKGPAGVALLLKEADGKDAATALRVAVLVEGLGYPPDAEELYRRYAREAKAPEAALTLARYLGRRKHTSEALDLCDAAWAKCPPTDVAEASVAVLGPAPADEASCARVEQRLAAALQKQPDQLELLLCVASLQELRGRYDDAEALYRKVLARDERSAVAANNLAWLLALHDNKGAEALAYVNRAVDVLGPIPELLDTRAAAAIAAGQLDAALADLHDALGRPGLDAKVRASLYYHLIEAETRAGGSREDMEKTWREAVAQGLAADVLHPLERAGYDKLAGEFGRTSSEPRP